MDTCEGRHAGPPWHDAPEGNVEDPASQIPTLIGSSAWPMQNGIEHEVLQCQGFIDQRSQSGILFGWYLTSATIESRWKKSIHRLQEWNTSTDVISMWYLTSNGGLYRLNQCFLIHTREPTYFTSSSRSLSSQGGTAFSRSASPHSG